VARLKPVARFIIIRKHATGSGTFASYKYQTRRSICALWKKDKKERKKKKEKRGEKREKKRVRERLKERNWKRDWKKEQERGREEKKKETYECICAFSIAIKGKFYLSK
jgi:hypothetical protein